MSDDIIKRLRDRLDSWRESGATGLWVNFLDLAALLARLDAAERENERLREDAERYRWLRGGSDIPQYSTRWARWEVRHWNGRHWLTLYAEQADDAIDAARREK